MEEEDNANARTQLGFRRHQLGDDMAQLGSCATQLGFADAKVEPSWTPSWTFDGPVGLLPGPSWARAGSNWARGEPSAAPSWARDQPRNVLA